MLNLKKTAVAVLAFGSTAVFAGTMGPVCTPGAVTVPCEHVGWKFAGQALYLEPSFAGLEDFWGSATTTAGVVTTTTLNRDPNRWAWGFKLEGAYEFGTGNDLDLNWYHWNNSRSGTIPTTVGSLSLLDGTVVYGNPYVRVKPRWDAVNLEFGQHVDFGDLYNIRFHGDIAYAGIRHNRSLTSTVTPTTFATSAIAIYESNTTNYNGVGPRVGADLSYDWGNGFSMYANTATALFVGTKKFNRYQAFANGTIFNWSASRTQIVPEVEAKLGGMYTYAMAQGDLSIDAGWMWINYFHGSVANADFGLQGPYVGLQWVGNFI